MTDQEFEQWLRREYPFNHQACDRNMARAIRWKERARKMFYSHVNFEPESPRGTRP